MHGCQHGIQAFVGFLQSGIVAGVAHDGAIGVEVAADDVFVEPVLEQAQVHVVFSGDGDETFRGQVFVGVVFGFGVGVEVHLVGYAEDDESGGSQFCQVFLHFFGRAFDYVKNVDEDGRLTDFFVSFLYPYGFDLVAGIADAGGVDKTEVDAPDVEDFLDGVAGGACDMADDGPLFFQDGIQQRGFPGIGPTGDDGIDAVFQHIAQLEGIDQCLEQGTYLFDELFQGVAVREFHIFLAEVELQLDEAGKIHQLLPQVGDFMRKAPPHLLHGNGMRRC